MRRRCIVLFHGCVVRVKMGNYVTLIEKHFPKYKCGHMTTASQHNPSFDHSGGRRRAEREQDACRGFKSRGPGRVEAFRGVGGIKRVEAFREWRHSEGGGIRRGGGL